jgi:ribonuclease BN (tRNA processing enzyme)
VGLHEFCGRVRVAGRFPRCMFARVPQPGSVEVVFLGSGDAFGSGGRLQTCFLVRSEGFSFLVDCGASALSSMRRFDVAPNDIGMVVLSHLHGDHFAGIPFLILDAQLVSERTEPLLIAGPPGTRVRIKEAMECLFPGSSTARREFPLEVIELEDGQRTQIQHAFVTPHAVRHPSGAPSFALRVECGGKTISYSGDTEWVDSLIPAARGADLFIAEAYFYDRKVPYHLDYRSLVDHLGELEAERVVLTHMSAEMLARVDGLDHEAADDGKQIDV